LFFGVRAAGVDSPGLRGRRDRHRLAPTTPPHGRSLREEERDLRLMDQIKNRLTTNWKGIEPTR
jgi:hypothetical protein